MTVLGADAFHRPVEHRKESDCRIVIRRLVRIGVVCVSVVTCPLLADIPAFGQPFITVVNVPPDTPPSSIGSDTQVNVRSGGFLEVVSQVFQVGEPNGSSENAELNLLEGGRVLTRGFLSDLRVHAGGQLNISGGEYQADLSANSGSIVHISGGLIGGPRPSPARKDIIARAGSKVILSGGDTFVVLKASDGSSVIMTGGYLFRLDVRNGADVTISGGIVDIIDARDTGAFTLQGGDFHRNGSPILELNEVGSTLLLQNPLPTGGTLSGVLADGTPFVFFEPFNGIYLNGSRIMLETVDMPLIEPSVFTASDGQLPHGYLSGQSLIVDEDLGVFSVAAGPGSSIDIVPGGRFSSMKAFGATVNIRGGTPSNAPSSGLIAIDSKVRMSDGFLRSPTFYSGSHVTVLGGEIESGMELYSGSEAVITGGLLQNLLVRGGGSADIGGGEILDLSVLTDGVAVVRGGEIARLAASDNANVNLIGSEFFLDGSAIPGLSPLDTLEITARDVLLSGTLADGSQFSFSLDPSPPRGGVRFSSGANLTVTLIPEPSSILLLGIVGVLQNVARRRR